MQVHFHGAAGMVTGSMHLVEAAGNQVMLDCGMIQGTAEAEALNQAEFPTDPATLDALVLSHAHIDHVADRIRELLQLEKQLLTLRECCRDGRQAADCGILNELSHGATEVAGPSVSESHLSATHAGGRRQAVPQGLRRMTYSQARRRAN